MSESDTARMVQDEPVASSSAASTEKTPGGGIKVSFVLRPPAVSMEGKVMQWGRNIQVVAFWFLLRDGVCFWSLGGT